MTDAESISALKISNTSNAGAVVHLGTKQADSYGLDENGEPVISLGLQGVTVMEEAIAAKRLP